MKIKCKVCGRIMQYKGTDSPMLKPEFWKEVVKFYNLEQYENEASLRFIDRYKKDPSDIWREEDHLFICKGCMQEALKIPLENTMLDCLFNNENKI